MTTLPGKEVEEKGEGFKFHKNTIKLDKLLLQKVLKYSFIIAENVTKLAVSSMYIL
jgi:hypothetical protein